MDVVIPGIIPTVAMAGATYYDYKTGWLKGKPVLAVGTFVGGLLFVNWVANKIAEKVPKTLVSSTPTKYKDGVYLV